MGSYGTAQVCLKGHITATHVTRSPEDLQRFCAKCGEPTIMECGHCGARIRGDYEGTWGFKTTPDAFCYECGRAYPWTVARQNALLEAIEELSDLDVAERERLRESVPDLIATTNKTEIAIARLKGAASRVSNVLSTMLLNVTTEVASEYVKEQLGLDK